MAAKVIWSPEAIEDLGSIFRYIAQSSPMAARRVGEQLLAVAESLGQFPNRGRVIPERKNPQLRELICHPYRIAYLVGADAPTVTILRLWHSARGDIEVPPFDQNA